MLRLVCWEQKTTCDSVSIVCTVQSGPVPRRITPKKLLSRWNNFGSYSSSLSLLYILQAYTAMFDMLLSMPKISKTIILS